MFERQHIHILALAVLLGGLSWALTWPGVSDGGYLGVSTRGWVALAVGTAIQHQLFVLVCWRSELHHRFLSRQLGSLAFPWYATIFGVLLFLRPVTVTALAIASPDTAPFPRSIGILLALPCIALAGFTGYSVRTHFGYRRAAGADHFDKGYDDRPFVRDGIFRYTPNAMYAFGMLALWIPGLLLASSAALAVAAFSHAYVWVHYFTTEVPDMRHIYSPSRQ